MGRKPDTEADGTDSSNAEGASSSVKRKLVARRRQPPSGVEGSALLEERVTELEEQVERLTDDLAATKEMLAGSVAAVMRVIMDMRDGILVAQSKDAPTRRDTLEELFLFLLAVMGQDVWNELFTEVMDLKTQAAFWDAMKANSRE